MSKPIKTKIRSVQNHLFDNLAIPGRWDQVMEGVRERVCEFLSKVSHHYSLDDIKTIFDVGSLNGAESYYFAQLLPNCKVWSFEANPVSAKMVKSNQEEFPHRLFCVEKAVSDRCGEITFYTTPQFPGCDSALRPLTESVNQGWLNSQTVIRPIRVASVTLENFCLENRIPSVDLIWMDVQGGELKVIEGMGNLRPKAIFAETGKVAHYEGHGMETDITEKLSSMGYVKQNRNGLSYTLDWEEDNLYILEKA